MVSPVNETIPGLRALQLEKNYSKVLYAAAHISAMKRMMDSTFLVPC